MALADIKKSDLDFYGFTSADYKGFRVFVQRERGSLFKVSVLLLWDENSDAHVKISEFYGNTIKEIKDDVKDKISALNMKSSKLSEIAARYDFCGSIEELVKLQKIENETPTHRNETLDKIMCNDRIVDKFAAVKRYYEKTIIKFSDAGERAYLVLNGKLWAICREQFGLFSYYQEQDLKLWLSLGGELKQLATH